MIKTNSYFFVICKRKLLGCFVRFDIICKILKNVKNTHGGVLILVKLLVLASKFTKSNNLPRAVFAFLKL